MGFKKLTESDLTNGIFENLLGIPKNSIADSEIITNTSVGANLDRNSEVAKNLKDKSKVLRLELTQDSQISLNSKETTQNKITAILENPSNEISITNCQIRLIRADTSKEFLIKCDRLEPQGVFRKKISQSNDAVSNSLNIEEYISTTEFTHEEGDNNGIFLENGGENHLYVSLKIENTGEIPIRNVVIQKNFSDLILKQIDIFCEKGKDYSSQRSSIWKFQEIKSREICFLDIKYQIMAQAGETGVIQANYQIIPKEFPYKFQILNANIPNFQILNLEEIEKEPDSWNIKLEVSNQSDLALDINQAVLMNITKNHEPGEKLAEISELTELYAYERKVLLSAHLDNCAKPIFRKDVEIYPKIQFSYKINISEQFNSQRLDIFDLTSSKSFSPTVVNSYSNTKITCKINVMNGSSLDFYHLAFIEYFPPCFEPDLESEMKINLGEKEILLETTKSNENLSISSTEKENQIKHLESLINEKNSLSKSLEQNLEKMELLKSNSKAQLPKSTVNTDLDVLKKEYTKFLEKKETMDRIAELESKIKSQKSILSTLEKQVEENKSDQKTQNQKSILLKSQISEIKENINNYNKQITDSEQNILNFKKTDVVKKLELLKIEIHNLESQSLENKEENKNQEGIKSLQITNQRTSDQILNLNEKIANLTEEISKMEAEPNPSETSRKPDIINILRQNSSDTQFGSQIHFLRDNISNNSVLYVILTNIDKKLEAFSPNQILSFHYTVIAKNPQPNQKYKLPSKFVVFDKSRDIHRETSLSSTNIPSISINHQRMKISLAKNVEPDPTSQLLSVLLVIKNLGNKTIDNLKIVDIIPKSAKILNTTLEFEKKSGSQSNLERIIWSIGQLNAFEEKLVPYFLETNEDCSKLQDIQLELI